MTTTADPHDPGPVPDTDDPGHLMIVTVTAQARDGQVTSVVQHEGSDTQRGLDELLIVADRRIRRRLSLMDHHGHAAHWLASLAHPRSEALAQWRASDVRLSLTDFVDGLRHLIPPNSVGDPNTEPGAILAAWRQIVTLVGADDPLPLSPASVVDRVAMLTERDVPAALRPRETVTGAEAVALLPPGSVFRTIDGDPLGQLTMVRVGDEVYAAGTSAVCHPEPTATFEVLHREPTGPTS